MTDIKYPAKCDPISLFKCTFSKTLTSGVDPEFFTQVFTAPDNTISQNGGNLVLNSGVTANAETIIRSNQAFVGAFALRVATALSQRIANNNFYVELVDVIGDGLAFTINSATSITVTVPNNSWTSETVGQSVYLGAFTLAGSIPGRYAIASVAGNDVTFTVAGFPASGTGTCSVFGWNYYQLLYTGTSATASAFDTQRRGWASGFSTLANTSTAAPGHIAIIQGENSSASLMDQSTASSTILQTLMRGSRAVNIPDDALPLYLQLRMTNGTTAPASSTTWTVGTVSMETFNYSPVSIVNIKPQSFNTPQPVQILGGISSVSAVTTVSAVTSANLAIPGTIADAASGAITTSATTTAITPTFGITYRVAIPVTAATGTNQTLDISVEESADSGTNWFKVYDFPRITATGIYQSPTLRLKGNRLRYVQTVGGTSPSFTRAINRLQSSSDVGTIIQLINRTIVLNTLNSTTPAIACDNIFNFYLTVRVTAQTTAATVALEFSDDGVNWWTSTTSVTTALGIVNSKVSNESWRFVRAIVTSAGSGITLDNVTIKGYDF